MKAKKRLLGSVLVILGIVTMIIFRSEDATAGLMLMLMGVAVIVCKEEER